MKILAFLQNGWFKNPDRVRQIFAKHAGRRRELVGDYLFMGSLTGRRIVQAFGDETLKHFEWEEASPQVGGKSNCCFPADLDHMRNAVAEVDPQIVLAFGKIAEEAVPKVWAGPFLAFPPPCGEDVDLRGNSVVGRQARRVDEIGS